jgi:hypothetical protein
MSRWVCEQDNPIRDGLAPLVENRIAQCKRIDMPRRLERLLATQTTAAWLAKIEKVTNRSDFWRSVFSEAAISRSFFVEFLNDSNPTTLVVR